MEAGKITEEFEVGIHFQYEFANGDKTAIYKVLKPFTQKMILKNIEEGKYPPFVTGVLLSLQNEGYVEQIDVFVISAA
jgi:hypothetical protein